MTIFYRKTLTAAECLALWGPSPALPLAGILDLQAFGTAVLDQDGKHIPLRDVLNSEQADEQA